MIKRVRQLLNHQHYQKLINNFSYLTLINVVNRALPLIIVPYIVRTIGIEKFGVITFAWAFASYAVLITQYSFSLTAVKHISLQKNNKEELSRYIWSMIYARFVLLLAVLFIYLVVVFSIEKFYLEREVMLYTFIAVFADILLPLYVFRGLEEMKYIAIFSITAKLLYTICVFLLVHSQSDYRLIPLLNGSSLLFTALFALYFVHRKYKLSVVKIKLAEAILLLKEGKDIFLSNMSVSFYTTINPVILGLLSNYSSVGIYSLAEAIYNAYSSIIKSYTAVIYPHLAQYIDKLTELYKQARKFFRVYFIILCFASIVLYVLSDFIITLLYGKGHEESILILKIFSIALLLEPLGGFFTAYLALKSQYKTIRSITLKTMIINLFLVFPAIYYFEAIGVAYLFLFLSVVQVYLNLYHNPELLVVQVKDYRT